MNPKPSDVMGMGVAGDGGDQQGAWLWDNEIGAVGNPGIQCWVCGAMGHIGRNCPSKGKGKGGGKKGSKGGPKGGSVAPPYP
eukprot:8839482-Karenia_brevis.AAC.1